MNVRIKNKKMNFFVRLFWLYLVTIHRFLYKFIKWEKDKSIMTTVTFAITVFAFYALIDSYLENPFITTRLRGFVVGGILFILIFPIHLWYDGNQPTEVELKEGKDWWTGEILFWTSLILLAFFRKFYIDNFYG